ncbi:MAG: 23S rRNA (pseudouridine(1915)-N(3))-methyltransferase RlmH [Erysipelotrichaceae bacterium]|nr:23S rRNA (pseudouridine(1915)-N(3))-methyltransferase RlmH [Erysipelotrichaceae bacterium]
MIKIVCVGKIKEKATSELIQEYAKRLGAYCTLKIEEVADEATLQNNSEALNEQVKKKEGERILGRIKDKEYVILLDLKGKMLSSEELSSKVEELFAEGKPDLTFVIGGSLGVSEEVIARADFRWQLSRLTFPHQLVRVLLLEQIYRAFKIMKHEPYHK